MVDSLLASFLAPFRRMAHILLALLQAHLILARSEARRDGARLAAGFAMLAVALLCLTQVWLLGHVLAIMLLREETRLSWGGSVAVVTGVDLLLGLVLALAARGKLNQPLMPETRELVRKTIETARG